MLQGELNVKKIEIFYSNKFEKMINSVSGM